MTSVHPEPQTPPQDGQQAPVEGNNQPPQQNIQQAAYGSSNQPQQYGQQIPYVAPNQYPQGQYGQQMPYGFQPQMQPMGPYMGQPTAFGGMGQLPGCGAPGYGMPWLPPPSKMTYTWCLQIHWYIWYWDWNITGKLCQNHNWGCPEHQ